MPSMSATCSMAFCGTQPPACSWPAHNLGMTAEAWRPSGYLAICPLAHFAFAGVKANSLGWISAGARRWTLIVSSPHPRSHNDLCEGHHVLPHTNMQQQRFLAPKCHTAIRHPSDRDGFSIDI